MIRAHLKRLLSCLLLTACGPEAGQATHGSGAGSGGGFGSTAGGAPGGWEPPPGDEDELGPRVLAMAYEGSTPRLVALGSEGELLPYASTFPDLDGALALRMLSWQPRGARGAVLLRDDGENSGVYSLKEETLTRIGSERESVVAVELSREGHLIVLHHADRSTSVVDHDDRLVLALPGQPDGDSRWLGFGDGDRWAMWRTNDDGPGRHYDVYDFASETTSSLGAWTSSNAFYTFATSVLRQRPHQPSETEWLDLRGNPLDVEGAPVGQRIGPERFFFNDGMAYQLRDREVVELEPQVLPGGRVWAYAPGAFALVDERGERQRLLLVDAQGMTLATYETGPDTTLQYVLTHQGPGGGLSVLVGIATQLPDGLEYWESLWRPMQDEIVRLASAEALSTYRFSDDGTLVRLADELATRVLPGASEEQPLADQSFVLEGFRYASE